MNDALLRRNREIVLPTASVAMLLDGLIRMYRRANNNALLPPTFSTDQLESIVLAMWEECITSRLIWVGDCVSANRVIDRIIPGYLHSDNTNRAAHIYQEIMAPVLEKCDDIIQVYVSQGSWKMWTVSPFGPHAHILEEGMDYRIYEWERMVKEKEISYPHIVLPDSPEVQAVCADPKITRPAVDPFKWSHRAAARQQALLKSYGRTDIYGSDPRPSFFKPGREPIRNIEEEDAPQ